MDFPVKEMVTILASSLCWKNDSAMNYLVHFIHLGVNGLLVLLLVVVETKHEPENVYQLMIQDSPLESRNCIVKASPCRANNVTRILVLFGLNGASGQFALSLVVEVRGSSQENVSCLMELEVIKTYFALEMLPWKKIAMKILVLNLVLGQNGRNALSPVEEANGGETESVGCPKTDQTVIIHVKLL